MQVGDIVTLKEYWRIKDIYYGLGVITFVEQGADESGAWKSFRVQWNDDFSFHDEEHLELISET
jgi:hypothetical protein